MAFVRARRRKSGVFYSVVEYVKIPGKKRAKRKTRSAGRNLLFARRWAAKLNDIKLARKAGFPIEDEPRRSDWTMQTLRDRDLEEARRAGHELPSRERRWRVILREIPPEMPIDQLPEHLEGFLSRRLDQASPATANRDLSVLSKAWKRARIAKQVQGNPFAELARPSERASRKPARALEPDTTRDLIRRAWKLAGRGPRWRDAAVVELLFRTASRLDQILKLRREQIEEKSLHFPPQKGGWPRDFPLTGRTGEILARLLRHAPAGQPWLFPGRKEGQPRENIRRFWTALLLDADLGQLRRHDLRHTAAHLAGAEGRTVAEIQVLLGHKTARMAEEIYNHYHRTLIPPVTTRRRRRRATLGSPTSRETRRKAHGVQRLTG